MTHQTDDTEVVRGSDTSLRDKVEQMYRQAARPPESARKN